MANRFEKAEPAPERCTRPRMLDEHTASAPYRTRRRFRGRRRGPIAQLDRQRAQRARSGTGCRALTVLWRRLVAQSGQAGAGLIGTSLNATDDEEGEQREEGCARQEPDDQFRPQVWIRRPALRHHVRVPKTRSRVRLRTGERHLIHRSQSTATSSAAQIWRMRSSLSLPIRSTSTASETLSTESRLTALGRPIGSSSGSSSTSLGRPLIVVVQGATSARRSRGIAASRDNTTTGRRPTSGGSHHQSSPRSGVAIRSLPQRPETMRGRPSRQAPRSDARHKPRTSHRCRRRGCARGTREEPDP